jgi:hypothetical protein
MRIMRKEKPKSSRRIFPTCGEVLFKNGSMQKLEEENREFNKDFSILINLALSFIGKEVRNMILCLIISSISLRVQNFLVFAISMGCC